MTDNQEPLKTTDLYFPPSEVATRSVESIKGLNQYRGTGTPLYIAGIDGYFRPLMAGQLGVVIAQSSNYKSGFFHNWSFHAGNALRERNKEHNEHKVVIHISTEEYVEEQGILYLAKLGGGTLDALIDGVIDSEQSLNKAGTKLATLPIFRVGLSTTRSEQRVHYDDLYLTNLTRVITELHNRFGVASIVIDYLQALPLDPEVKAERVVEQRRLQVRRDIYRMKEWALDFSCPVWVAVQAKQNMSTSGSRLKLPGIYDGEETSAIAQRADRILTLWMPKMDYQLDDQIDIAGRQLLVQENTLLVKVGKQRGRLPSGRTWVCNIDFSDGGIEVDQQFHDAAAEAQLEAPF